MSRSVSATFKSAVFAQQTDEAFLVLIEIDHTDLASPIRVTSDGVNTTHNSNTYTAFPFELSLPDDPEHGATQAQLTIDNVDRQIVEAVRSITSPADVHIKVVLASDPDTVEADFPNFQLVNVSYNALTVTGTLTLDNVWNFQFPAGSFTPGTFPGLF